MDLLALAVPFFLLAIVFELGIWFRRTGWRPADVETMYPKGHSDLMTFEKFDPPVSPSMRRYLLGQFLAAILGTLAIADLFVTAGARGVAIPCLLLWTQLYVLGAINEGRRLASRLEIARLLLVVPLGTAVWQATTAFELASEMPWPVAAAYIGVSLAWFLTVIRKELLKQQLPDIS